MRLKLRVVVIIVAIMVGLTALLTTLMYNEAQASRAAIIVAEVDKKVFMKMKMSHLNWWY